MFTEVNLNDPTSSVPPTEALGGEALSDSAARHHPPPSSQTQTPIPPSSTTRVNNSTRRTMRGRTSYHFSVKRPRRNVVRRSIASFAASSSRLEYIEEEKETLLGIDMSHRHDGGHDPYRAPRLAVALFVLVCTAGGYRGFNEYWLARDAASSAIVTERGDAKREDDVTSFFRGSANDGEHREAILTAADGLEGGAADLDEADAGIIARNIEDVPTLLFDEAIPAPDELSNLADVFHEQYDPLQNKLFLWQIPRSGSTSIARIASYCLGLVVASDAGKSEARIGGPNNQELRIVEGLDGVRFANVDTSNPEGIAKAKMFNVGQNVHIDLVASPYLWDLASIFDEGHKGYMVAMIRHPIERATSLYYSMRKSPQYEKQVGSLTSIEQYAKSSLVENNWMTRFLSNALSGELTPEHEAIAKEVLRTKCIIGLFRDKTETMRRLEIFFNLKARERSQRRDECQEKLLYWDWPGKNRHEPVIQGSEAWDTLYKQNTFDVRLYEYAEELFVAQGKIFQDSHYDVA